MILLGFKNCDKITFELRVGIGGERKCDKTRFEFSEKLKIVAKLKRYGEWIYLGVDSPGFGVRWDVKMTWGFWLEEGTIYGEGDCRRGKQV